MDLNNPSLSTDATLEVQRAFLARVYRWMFVGLGVTAAVAYAFASSQALMLSLLQHRGTFLLLAGVELLLVMALSAFTRRLSGPVAGALFLGYAALNGITFSVVLLAYAPGSVGQIFLLTALVFGGMSVYASSPGRDLSGWGPFLYMGLFGVVIAALVNLFVHSNGMAFVLSCASVVVFTGLTAYDTQKLRQLALSLEGPDGESTGDSLAVVGALELYLDFVNLFLSLLRLFGKRR